MKLNLKTYLSILIIVGLIAAAIVILITQNKSFLQNKSDTQPTVQFPLPTPALGDIQRAIASQFNAKNFTKVQESMHKPTVEVTIQSTECCMFVPPEEASKQLTYVEKGIPMDFNQNNQTIIDLKTKHPELKGSYIGMSKNGTQLIAFFFNKENAISRITMAASWKIFDFSQPQPSPN